jgi:hypothetical protein
MFFAAFMALTHCWWVRAIGFGYTGGGSNNAVRSAVVHCAY